jgi:GMP synthase (glutamine-hydrolysing)
VRKILLVTHQETSDPGLVGQILAANGYTLDVRRPCMDEALPKTMDEHDGVVIFGGAMSANDDHLPFIRAELDWIPMAIASGKPYLGICLGAQLLARVLGASVTPHPQGKAEIGYVTIAPLSTELALPKAVYHWHKEGFDLPQDAVLLASGEVFPNQAFRYGESVYGLQFHPEITAEMVDRWTTSGMEQLTRPEAQPREQQIADHHLYGPVVEHWLNGFLRQWLRLPELSVRRA